MPSNHALLSPSAASRWIQCPRSLRLSEGMDRKTSDAADEGTLAHALGELLIRLKSKDITKAKFDVEFKKITADKWYNKTMLEYCEDYASYIMECFAAATKTTKDAILLLEQEIDLRAVYAVEDGFGTADAVIIANKTLYLRDLKYGKGVLVNAVDNTQLKIYALGVLEEYAHVYGIETVVVGIYQPRMDNISEWEVSVEDLYAWRDSVLRPKAQLAFAGMGELVAGDHCKFCPLKATCVQHAAFQMEIAKHDFEVPAKLTPEAIAEILTKVGPFKSWLSELEDYAQQEALKGNFPPGFKLVEGRSNRVISNETGLVKKLVSMGLKKKDMYVTSLLALGKLENLVGKQAFNESCKEFVTKPKGAPTLVPVSDKRPAIGSAEDAKADFEGVEL